jgi:2-keto-4-pentenoate hydratase/2-oxohepta-3-ene-1,7-dioic acid hydratase in catechol pathway
MSIYCIGRNYAEHAAELGNPVPAEPVVFLKSTAALRPLAGGITAFPGETFHHEAELVVRLGRSVPFGAEAGWEAVDALALGIDLTRREVQARLKEKGLPWTTAKSFAGSALVGDFVPLARFEDPEHIEFGLSVNGEPRQHGDTRAMLFRVPALLAYLASLHPLAPGDLIYTGTPKGVGPLQHGDSFQLEFTQLGMVFTGRL